MTKKKPVLQLMAYLFFAYSILTIIANYMPIYFKNIGLSATEIGLLLSVGPLAAIFAQPFWGYMSDKYKTIKRILLIVVFGTFIATILLFQMNNLYGFLVMMFVLYLFLSPVTALGDSLSQKTAVLHHVSFGKIRMWGSLGFAVVSLLAGYYFTYVGIDHLMYPVLFMAIMAFLFALTLKDVNATNKPVTVVDALKIGANPKFFSFLFIIVLVSITHRTNDSYLGIYITELGGKESLIGWAWFIGVVSEAIVFYTSAIWLRKFQPITFILFAASLYAVRWFLMAMATIPETLLILQVLHGITFAVMYICAFQVVTNLVPEELLATGHVLFITMFFGVAGILGSFSGGLIIEHFSIANLYMFLGYLAIAGGIALYIYKVVVDQGKRSKERLT